MDRRRTCTCFCSCSNRTGVTFIASLYIVQSILSIFTLSTIAKLDSAVLIDLGSFCICAALGFVLLLGADKRDVGLAKTFYVGVCVLLVLRGLSVVQLLISGQPAANLLGDGLAICLNLYFLSVVNSFIEEIKAERRSEAEAGDADGEDGGGCCCSLQTCTIFFGSTFIITSIPGAIWLAYAWVLLVGTFSPAGATVAVLGFVVCIVYTALGTCLLTGADRKSISRTRAGLFGVCTLLALRTSGFGLGLIVHRHPKWVTTLEAVIIFFHVCALLTMRNFMREVKAGSPDQGQGQAPPLIQMENLRGDIYGDQIV